MAEDLLSWKSQYNLGLDEIDAQHKSLLDLINKAWLAIVQRSDQSVVLAVIEELERYTLAHFAAEETFMRVTEYPGFAEHKREHGSFIARIAEEKQRAIATGSLSLDLMYYLRDWLIDTSWSPTRPTPNSLKQTMPAGRRCSAASLPVSSDAPAPWPV